MFYLDLFRALQHEEVEYVVVGGLAVMFHGVERSTMDVDLVLAMSEENLRRFLVVATSLQLAPTLPVPLASLCDARQMETWVREKNLIAFSLHSKSGSLPTVDIIVQPKIPFDMMYRDRLEKEIGDVRVNFASIDALIALKTGTGRTQDASDVRALQVVKRVESDEDTNGKN